MSAPAEADLAEGIRSVLAGHVRGDPGDLRVTPIPGGASRETWLAEARKRSSSDERVPVAVLRRDPEGSVSLVPMREEHALLKRARAAGVPVPEPIAFEGYGGAFGSPGILMDFVEGTSVAPLARVHSLGPADVDGVLPPSPPDPALGQIEEWERQVDEIGEPLPAVELGLRWLRANAPEPAETRLVHGDFRLGNFIVDEDGLAAVIDWELSHLGDPAEDIGWLCIRSWRFGSDELPVGGVGELEAFLAAYEEAGGDRPSAERTRYWELLGNVKWAVICARQAADHRTGVRRSHELASLGRRICEPEWDMLQLMRSA